MAKKVQKKKPPEQRPHDKKKAKAEDCLPAEIASEASDEGGS
jgi:hypothetical protein